MDRTPYEHLRQEIAGLPSDQQRHLWLWLGAQLAHHGAAANEHEADIGPASDTETNVAPPLSDAEWEAVRSWRPVPIQGKPLSETIIEERR